MTAPMTAFPSRAWVQHVHTLPNALPPLSVHMTYQFAEGSKFAYGKRQRLRQAGLWLVEPDSYYNGRYLKVVVRLNPALLASPPSC